MTENIRNINKVLIANRGEIAVRIIRTLKKMNIASVAVFSEADRESLHVHMADEAWFLGDGPLSETYLNIERIMDIASKSISCAIHPGYGFLSEHPGLVSACEEANIIFIGPDSRSIKLMGNKIAAREFAVECGLPVTMGITGTKTDIMENAHTIPFPVLVKAAAGGGGKGMRIVREPSELQHVLETTSREASSYFGDGSVYLEQYIEEPRHIEIQVLGDHYGNVIHLFERECSVQRRYQKIIEESPSPTLTPEVRAKMGAAAVAICSKIAYRSAGTIEFLVDKNLDFYFLEMNTRIQVEHPVTEMVTGVDLVEEQIHIASGVPLRYRQDELQQKGHAIECRIYAENPSKNFMPSPGWITLYHEPQMLGLRIDSAIDRPQQVHSFFDPMISKLIAYGKTRNEAMNKATHALEYYIIHGISTNISYLNQMLKHPSFVVNKISTKFCDEHTIELLQQIEKQKSFIQTSIPISSFLMFDLNKTKLGGTDNLWEEIGYWRNRMHLMIQMDGNAYPVDIDYLKDGTIKGKASGIPFEARLNHYADGKLNLEVSGRPVEAYVSYDSEGHAQLSIHGHIFNLLRNDLLNDSADYSSGDTGQENGSLFAPMPGKVIKVHVQDGDEVKRGSILLVVEAMKMENNIVATNHAKVDKVNVKEGDMVDTKTQLIHLTEFEQKQ
jgi:acetyl-CoA carboxylase biotin carboxylase subunit